jgi:methylenetetrahydrofolate dehydrogenase (NADP+)/methenyltetrahydrofolate cyclohydrolase
MKIDGRQIAQDILNNLKTQTEELKKKNIYPKLAIILVGDDPSSVSYINQKEIKADLIGIQTIIKHFPSATSTADLLESIGQFNNNKDIHGIIVQQPLPKQINREDIIKAIDPKKDVDGFHSDSNFQMPIVSAVLKILEIVYSQTHETQISLRNWLKNKKIVIIGKGETAGKPIIKMFEKMKISVSLIDSETENPEDLTKKADIIISAVGKASILKPEMIKEKVILIGIGISRSKSAKLMGDYDQNEVKDIVSFYTPTPGGIGPINVAYLLKNLVDAAGKF